MGKFKQGILGGFSGKVGTVIGTFWKGRNVMKGLPQHVHNPNTPDQQAQRARFKLVSQFLSVVGAFIKIGYRNYTAVETAANAAMRDNLAKAVTGSGTAVSLDLDKVQLSKGALLNVENPAVVTGTAHSCNVTWTDNTGAADDALATDIVMVCLYNQAKSASIYDAVSATRADEALSVYYPSGWAGNTVTVFACTSNVDRSNLSDSVKVGSFTAA